MSDSMALLKEWGPTLLGAGGSLKKGMSDAKALNRQAGVAAAQGYMDEQVQRRQARAQLGEQAAAIAQAGIGYGGTTALVMQDSELAAEMDALNYRYRGLQQADALRAQARSARKQAYNLAGSKLLSGAAEKKHQRTILSNAST